MWSEDEQIKYMEVAMTRVYDVIMKTEGDLVSIILAYNHEIAEAEKLERQGLIGEGFFRGMASFRKNIEKHKRLVTIH